MAIELAEDNEAFSFPPLSLPKAFIVLNEHECIWEGVKLSEGSVVAYNLTDEQLVVFQEPSFEETMKKFPTLRVVWTDSAKACS